MVETTIFKGYRNGQEVWAIRKVYGSGETQTEFLCEIEPTKEIIAEYGKQKNVCDNNKAKKRACRWLSNWRKLQNQGVQD